MTSLRDRPSDEVFIHNVRTGKIHLGIRRYGHIFTVEDCNVDQIGDKEFAEGGMGESENRCGNCWPKEDL